MQKKYLKIMSAALCAAMCTSLVACGSSGDSSSSDSKIQNHQIPVQIAERKKDLKLHIT